MVAKDETVCSWQFSGDCELGDARRTDRLVSVATLVSRRMGKSLAKSCEGDRAALLGIYRLLRNDDVSPQAFCQSSAAGA